MEMIRFILKAFYLDNPLILGIKTKYAHTELQFTCHVTKVISDGKLIKFWRRFENARLLN